MTTYIHQRSGSSSIPSKILNKRPRSFYPHSHRLRTPLASKRRRQSSLCRCFGPDRRKSLFVSTCDYRIPINVHSRTHLSATMDRPVGRAKSCVTCRQYKLRCDARQMAPNPCSRCVSKNLKCRFDPHFKRISTRRYAERPFSPARLAMKHELNPFPLLGLHRRWQKNSTPCGLPRTTIFAVQMVVHNQRYRLPLSQFELQVMRNRFDLQSARRSHKFAPNSKIQNG